MNMRANSLNTYSCDHFELITPLSRHRSRPHTTADRYPDRPPRKSQSDLEAFATKAAADVEEAAHRKAAKLGAASYCEYLTMKVEYGEIFKVSFINEKLQSAVFKFSPKIKKLLMNNKRVHIDMGSCLMKPYFHVCNSFLFTS